MTTELGPDDLLRRCDPRALPFETTADAREPIDVLGQSRAIDALRFGIDIQRDGYNLFALGAAGTGRHAVVRELLARRADEQETPPDWCYVDNRAEPHRPRALRLPAGAGARLRAEMARAIAELRTAMPATFDSDEYRSRKRRLVEALEQRHEAAFDEVRRRATDRRVAVVRTESGIALAPLRGDEVIEPAAFAQLPAGEQEQLRAAIEATGAELNAMFRQLHAWTHEHRDALAALERELAAAVARQVFDRARDALRDVPIALAFLDDIERDVIAHADRFLHKPEPELQEALHQALAPGEHEDHLLRGYQVNLLVDHGEARGAPVVYEDNPTYANLIGRIDHQPRLGALVTDFSLIRAGALHRANGGYLLLDALEVLQHPMAWQALQRALRTREIRIESIGQALGLASTVSLEPEPIPLEDMKVVLFGDPLLHELLAQHDADFGELFKVIVDFDGSMPRRREADAEYARLVAGLVGKEGLRPFDRGAVARVIEHAARLAGDAQRLSLRRSPVLDLLREADHVAAVAGRNTAHAADVDEAIEAQHRRAGRLRARVLDAIRRGTLVITTSGTQVGQVNGLSVVDLAAQRFAHPIRITARARIGDGGVIDIEREVELGGPVHSKGVMILAGFLGARYAADAPLSLSATVVFEQSYGEVEGDSASLAELCALLSAIGDVPLRQDLAVTGSIDQHGRVQPVGGIDEKIEGFFDVCRDRGLTGAQGVIIPRASVPQLMLRRDVVAAVAERRFHVHAVTDVDEAVALLAGRPAGARDAGSEFPAESVNGLVEARLRELAERLRRYAADGEPPAADHP